MIKLLSTLACFSLITFISGCEYTSVNHQTPNGSLTNSSSVSLLIRSHTRIQNQQGSDSPLPAEPAYSVANTASNTTGFESILQKTTLAPKDIPYPTDQTTVVGSNNSNNDFFVFDSDKDPEPAIRAARIGAQAVVASQIVTAVK